MSSSRLGAGMAARASKRGNQIKQQQHQAGAACERHVTVASMLKKKGRCRMTKWR